MCEMSEPQSKSLARERVATLVGKCLLNFQLYEVRLKRISPLIELSVTESGFDLKRCSTDTLGMLVKAFSAKALALEGQDEPEEKLGLTIRYRQSFLSKDDYDKRISSLAELVRARNYLVHHFYEDYDLSDVESCNEAKKYLDRILGQTNEWLDEQKQFMASMSTLMELSKQLYTDPNVSCRILEVPPSDANEWRMLNEVIGLQAAEKLKASDGYTNLDKAISYLQSTGIAHDAYRQIGLSSWQQLLYESGCFDILKTKDEATGRWARRYRSKPL